MGLILTNLAQLIMTMTRERYSLLGWLIDVLGDYCKANNLEHMSADDILTTHENLTDEQKLWLKTFIKMWDKAQELES